MPIFFPGPFAVTLFFELSGLLITWLLLKGNQPARHVGQAPILSTACPAPFPCFLCGMDHVPVAGPFAGSWATFFYMGDYYHALTQRYNILTVGWSLGVEEKFYLLWPFLLARVERNRLVKILFGVLIFEPIYRSALTLLGYRTYTWFAFDTHLDPIVLGCLIAIAARNGWTPPKWMSHPATPLCALILVFALQSQSDAVTYLLAVILVSVICRPPALLNHPLARYFGAISYSLYLSHDYAREILWPHLLGPCTYTSPQFRPALRLTIPASHILASALHYAIERPFLHLKDRFHTTAS